MLLDVFGSRTAEGSNAKAVVLLLANLRDLPRDQKNLSRTFIAIRGGLGTTSLLKLVCSWKHDCRGGGSRSCWSLYNYGRRGGDGRWIYGACSDRQKRSTCQSHSSKRSHSLLPLNITKADSFG